MYKYQCSKKECGHKWELHEGNLNGFTLTCPVCGKGRGLFIEQSKDDAYTGNSGENGKQKNIS